MDVGANLGTRAIEFVHRYPRAVVYALEPNPLVFRLMMWNVRANNVTGSVWPLNVALVGGPKAEREDAHGTKDHYIAIKPPLKGHRSGFVESSSDAELDGSSFSVPAWSLSALLERLSVERVDLLKLNCEGCEYGVLGDDAVQRRINSGSIGHIVGELHEPGDASPRSIELARRAMCGNNPSDRAGICDGFSVRDGPS
eukprot:TRINITY_DN48247_c0_g1_i1.p1 TRINITY_DN48247_c0_g1~~TRINITY_DN48247_c0_g1_i1.p1  ORF type:complete len:198 (+),score=11.56 TRINITY_DN48247_c0_g1_i1:2-595(+)